MRDAVRRRPGDIFFVEEDSARSRRKGAGEQIEERGLARAVRPDDRVQRAGLDLERHAVDRGERAERLPQVVRFENRHAMNLAHASTTPPRKNITTTTNASPSSNGQRAHKVLTDSESQMNTNEPMIGP